MPAIVTKQFVVGPGDIDELNHVNNQVYLRWAESAAREATAQNDWPEERYFQLGSAWVARQHWIEYLRPCLLGDTITVYTWVQSMNGPRCLRRYAMKNGNKLCCVAATEWDFVSLSTKRLQECPEEVLSHFEIVPQDDPRLRELGILRSVRYEPVGLL